MNDASTRHVFAARLFACFSLLLLLFLFIFPYRQVKSMRAAILPLADAATEAVVLEDWEQARAVTQTMLELYGPYDKPLRLYLDHEDVDALRTRILSCRNLARAEDEQIIVDLEDTKNGLNYLVGIETFDLWNLF